MRNPPGWERSETKFLEVEACRHALFQQSGLLSCKSAILLGVVSLCVISVAWYLASSPKGTSLKPETLKEIDALVAEMHKKNVGQGTCFAVPQRPIRRLPTRHSRFCRGHKFIGNQTPNPRPPNRRED